MSEDAKTVEMPKVEPKTPTPELVQGTASDLPKAPVVTDYDSADTFKDAIRVWAAMYESAYAALYPVAQMASPPPEPGPEPKMPPGPPEPLPQEGVEHGLLLREWLPKQEAWFFKEYLPWEITRTRWYVAKTALRDWEALKRLEARQRAEFKHRLVVAILRFVITGVVTGGVVLLGLRLLG